MTKFMKCNLLLLMGLVLFTGCQSISTPSDTSTIEPISPTETQVLLTDTPVLLTNTPVKTISPTMITPSDYQNPYLSVKNMIIVRVHPDEPSLFERGISNLMIMDGDGHQLDLIDNMTGEASAWSPDGKMIAFGSYEDPTQLNILNAELMPDMSVYPRQNYPTKAPTIRTLMMPGSCQQAMLDGIDQDSHHLYFQGFQSISWSPDGKSIAVVCGSNTYHLPRVLCIIPSDGSDLGHCWEKNPGDGIVMEARYSPINDVLAVSVTPKDNRIDKSSIYSCDPSGKNCSYLVEGRGQSWSSDGSRLAFIHKGDKGSGLMVMNYTDKVDEWLIEPFYYSDPIMQINNINFSGCGDTNLECSTSWSPDSRYIIANANIGPSLWVRLLRINLITKEIVIISPSLFGFYLDPTWGPD